MMTIPDSPFLWLKSPAFHKDVYEPRMANLQSRMARVRALLGLLWRIQDSQIFSIPAQFELFFLQNAAESMRDICLIELHSLLKSGKQSDMHSLTRFAEDLKAEIQDHLLPHYESELIRDGLDRKCLEIAEKIASIRDNQVAHHLYLPNSGTPKGSRPRLVLEEMQDAFFGLFKLWQVVSLQAHFGLNYMDEDETEEVDRLITHALEHSTYLNQPETLNPEYWNARRSQFVEGELQLFNRLRRRAGMSEVD